MNTNSMKKVLVFGSILAATVLLAGCGGGGSGGGSSSSSGGACGFNCGSNQQSTIFGLSVSAMSSPADTNVEAITLGLQKMELVNSSGTAVNIPVSANELEIGASSGLDTPDVDQDGYGIPGGQYTKIVLTFAGGSSDYVTGFDGDEYTLNVPAKITIPISLDLTGPGADYYLGLDLRRDLTESTGAGGVPEYTLGTAHQVLVTTYKTGMMAGTVSESATVGGVPVYVAPTYSPNGTAQSCDPAVYVYLGDPKTLGGYSAQVKGGAAPYIEATATQANNGNWWANELPAGQYTVALTCSSDDVAGATSLKFSAPRTVTVVALQDQQVNF